MKTKPSHQLIAGPVEYMAWLWGPKKMISSKDHYFVIALAGDVRDFRIYKKSEQGKIGECIANDKHADLLQYTGYLDRDGAKIYGGDMLESEDGTIRKVVFHDGQWCFRQSESVGYFLSPLHKHAKYHKKIGNHLTHPEVWTE